MIKLMQKRYRNSYKGILETNKHLVLCIKRQLILFKL